MTTGMAEKKNYIDYQVNFEKIDMENCIYYVITNKNGTKYVYNEDDFNALYKITGEEHTPVVEEKEKCLTKSDLINALKKYANNEINNKTRVVYYNPYILIDELLEVFKNIEE